MPRHNEPANRVTVAQRRQQAVEMRRTGHTWQQIADELGYYDRGHAHRDIRMAFAQEQDKLFEDLARFRDEETLELMAQRAVAWESLSALGVHVHVTKDGEVVTNQVEDPELALKALDRLNRISARLAALRGIDAPVKVEQSGTVMYRVEGVDMSRLS